MFCRDRRYGLTHFLQEIKAKVPKPRSGAGMDQGPSIWDRIAWGAWIALVMVVSLRPFVSGPVHTVYPIYTRAASDWLAGEKIYGLDNRPAKLDQFRYAPVLAVVMIPFEVLPMALGEALWRVLGAAMFLYGF